jgi:polyisoprenoid-binding protein YceI
MIRSLVAAAVVSAALAGTARAQVSTTNPNDVRPGSYAVEPSHTRVLFAVSHMGFTTWYGQFTNVSGTLVLDPKDPSKSSITVSIPSATITTTNAVLDAKLKGGDWLGVSSYPSIVFKSTSVHPTGNNNAIIDGDLTLHGFTHPVVLQAHFNGAGMDPITRDYTVGFEANTRIKRSAFGVNTYVPLIGDDVTVTISAAFVPK